MRRLRVLAMLALAIGPGCTRTTPGDSDTGSGDSALEQRSPGELRAEISRLEERARALARVDGCDSVAQCKAAPVGERACGGPREYIVYCSAATDEAALLATLDTLRTTEMRLNEIEQAVSTCEYRMPPEMEVVGGSCRAK